MNTAQTTYPAGAFTANVNPWDFVGEQYGFNGQTLELLAESFRQATPTALDMFFPTYMHDASTVVVNQLFEGFRIMPPVQVGIPNGSYLEQNRMRRMTLTPQAFRENDAFEYTYVRALRDPLDSYSRISAETYIAQRIEQIMQAHRRTLTVFQSRMMLGGWKFRSPETGVAIDVSSNIPATNFFRYNGWSSNVAANTTVNVAQSNYTAFAALDGSRGRNEAAYFRSASQVGVPWTNKECNIIEGLQLLKLYLEQTVKNKFTHIILSSQLIAVIKTVNEQIKSYSGQQGLFVNNTNGMFGGPQLPPGAHNIVIGPGGDILSIAGLTVIEMDGVWRNPQTNVLEMYWPSHKVALVCANSSQSPATKLGYTYHCTAESDKPGLWINYGETQLPSPKGMAVQVGDCFIPFPVYPHWIAQLDVCEINDITSSLPILSDLGYGLF